MISLHLIKTERDRQRAKSYDQKHDDAHGDGFILALAVKLMNDLAGSYATGDNLSVAPAVSDEQIRLFQKYKDNPVHLLVVVGALVAAEIERILRVMWTPEEQVEARKLGWEIAEISGKFQLRWSSNHFGDYDTFLEVMKQRTNAGDALTLRAVNFLCAVKPKPDGVAISRDIAKETDGSSS